MATTRLWQRPPAIREEVSRPVATNAAIQRTWESRSNSNRVAKQQAKTGDAIREIRRKMRRPPSTEIGEWPLPGTNTESLLGNVHLPPLRFRHAPRHDPVRSEPTGMQSGTLGCSIGSTSRANALQLTVLHRLFAVAHERTTAFLTQMGMCASGKNFGVRFAHGGLIEVGYHHAPASVVGMVRSAANNFKERSRSPFPERLCQQGTFGKPRPRFGYFGQELQVTDFPRCRHARIR